MSDPEKPEAQEDDEPGVLGGGCGLTPVPSRAEAEAVWRQVYVDRMVARGVDREDAQACSDAGDVDLTVDPADAADDELLYWGSDAE